MSLSLTLPCSALPALSWPVPCLLWHILLQPLPLPPALGWPALLLPLHVLHEPYLLYLARPFLHMPVDLERCFALPFWPRPWGQLCLLQALNLEARQPALLCTVV